MAEVTQTSKINSTSRASSSAPGPTAAPSAASQRTSRGDSPPPAPPGARGAGSREVVDIQLSGPGEKAGSSPVNFAAWQSDAQLQLAKGEYLRLGSENEHVTTLQKMLRERGATGLEVDGVMGKLTHKAVEDFQRREGIEVDGIVGPETMGRLNRKPDVSSTSGVEPVSAAQGARPLGGPKAPIRAPGKPPDYFAFASDTLSPRAVSKLAERYKGNVMIGIDVNSDYAATEKAARAGGARLHVYLEGPGGPTNKRIASDELARMKKAAGDQGIDTRRSDWMTEWNRRGWKPHTLKQLREFKQRGYESAEIDNLYRGLGNSPERLVDFYKEYAGWYKNGEVPKALLKNISGPQMDALATAIRNGQIPREMFSDFAIFETSAGSPGRSMKIGSELGIRTLLSYDTNDYRASGSYR